MHGRLCVKAWRTNSDLDSYYFKLEMSAFIGKETSLAGPGLTGPLRTYFQGTVKQNFILQKVRNKSASVIFRLARLIVSLCNKIN